VARLLNLTTEDELEVLRVNLAGVAAMTREAAKAIEHGSIVNISSIEGLQPPDAHSHYAASKAGVLMHTRTAAAELGPQGIRVNAVAPGLIDDGTLDQRWPDGVARWHAAAPLRRMGSAMDVADAVLFLASSAARWITGSTLVVDGGVLARNTW
jgi:3-oxoacyl-[acyl-carrier protein] reductase